ncbi:MAG: carotenoid 1,2-hydratase [Alphaproteobacteria bacterium]
MRALLLALLLALAVPAVALAPAYAPARPGVALTFPMDHGAHSAFRTEWWYVTGWLKTADGKDLGFQVTFFRSRTAADPANPSRFNPDQILFAHAALSDPEIGHLLHGQRIARQGFGLAQASTTDTDFVIDDWRLKRGANGVFSARAAGADFRLDLDLAPQQNVLLQGEHGYSRKGPSPAQASQYYSLPHMAVSGSVVRSGKRVSVTGEAWLDREWASSLLDPKAVGWDWVGLNLDDGGALMAFMIRDKAGKPIWNGGALRSASGALTTLGKDDVAWGRARSWRSPRTQAAYPVERVVSVRSGGQWRRWTLRPLFDDQELDSRAAGGPVYWEGAVHTEGGRGYLELTGYAGPLKL